MEVQLAVPETTIDRIHIDDPATITFPTLPGESAKGRISLYRFRRCSGRRLSSQSGADGSECKMSNPA